ncbi:MAG: hypothetical protein J6V88_00460 [Kiritimatiellae bacterium]|nr:hypothetical protein [Kiritimatiellia bacterium]
MKRVALSVLLLPTIMFAGVSNEIDLFVETSHSHLWRTSESLSPVIEWETPSTAVSATLSVDSLRGEEIYDVTGKSKFELKFCEPNSLEDEDVYDLTLTFDCGTSNVVKKGQIGVVCGLGSTGTSGATANLRTLDSKWNRLAARKAIIPIYAGNKVFTIDGEEVETGLEGTAGWFGWKSIALKNESYPYELLLVTDSGNFEASIITVATGLILIVR